MRAALLCKDSDRQDKEDTELMRKEHRLGEAISEGQTKSGRPSPTACKLSPQHPPPTPSAPQSNAGKQATEAETREVNPLTPPTQKHTTDHLLRQSSVPLDTPFILFFSKRMFNPPKLVSILDLQFWKVLKTSSAYRKQGFLRHLKRKIYLLLLSTREVA